MGAVCPVDAFACAACPPSRSDSEASSDLYAGSDVSSIGPSASLNFAGASDAFEACEDAVLAAAVRASGAAGSGGGGDASSASSASGAPISNAALGAILDEVWPVAREAHSCVTADGVRLHLVRGSCPAAAAARPRRGHPVILVPGLAASSEATWDITPGLSLFAHLARQGYDAWRVDLRGNGRSGAPEMTRLGEGWCVDDHLFKDMPALVDYVIEATGASQLHWIGHSMGGMLATGALSLQAALSRRIRSVTMLGSGCFGTGSWHSVLKPLVLGLCYFGFPGAAAGGAIGRLVGTWARLSLLEAAFYWDSNMEPEVARRLMSTCFRFIPHGLISQFMRSMNSPQGLTTADGRNRYCDPSVLRHVAAPVLGVTGDWDLFCPPPGGLRTVMAFGGETRRFVFLGPAYGTATSSYGHFDVIMGRNARSEVWPHVTTFLAEHDAPAPAPGAAIGAAAVTKGAPAALFGAAKGGDAGAASDDASGSDVGIPAVGIGGGGARTRARGAREARARGAAVRGAAAAAEAVLRDAPRAAAGAAARRGNC